MTDLRTLVDALKREVAVPGTYDDVFPDTGPDQLAATLADAFAEAQLQGFFGDVSLTVDATVSPASYETSKPLSAAGGALIVLFAGMRILRSQMRTLSQSATYKAGSVEYSTANMTTVIRDELKALRDRLDGLIVDGKRSGRAVAVADTYAKRLSEGRLAAYTGSLGAFFTYERP